MTNRYLNQEVPQFENNTALSSLWGIAPVAPLHLGYDALLNAQRQLIKQGLNHTILLADNHAMLTHGYSWEEVNNRAIYYEIYLKQCCGLDCQILRGSSFQTRADYIELLYSTLQSLPVSKVKNSLSQVSKKMGLNSLKVSGYVYGIMQVLDGYYLNKKVIFAEESQAKIYNLAKEIDPARINQLNSMQNSCDGKDGYFNTQEFIYIPSGHDIKGKPLNQSKSATRISLHESEESLEWKISEMFAPPANQKIPEDRTNALLEYFEHSVFPWVQNPIAIKGVDGKLNEFMNYEEFESEYSSGRLHPSDCKDVLYTALRERLMKLRPIFGEGVCHWIDLPLVRGQSSFGGHEGT